MNDAVEKKGGKNWIVFLSVALLLGAVLRLSFPNDIEYKSDEKYMFEAVRSIGVTESWPRLGMMSGSGTIQNPGMSVWVFERKVSFRNIPAKSFWKEKIL